MRIIRLEAENVKKLRAVAIEPTGNVVQITGANGSGKTSVLDCIWMAMAGKGAVPVTPVRVGEESARITLDLGEYIVTRTFTAEGTTSLKVTTPQGAAYSSPQTLLDKWLGALTFDPLAFTRLKPREQREQLAQVAGLRTMLDTLAAEDKADFDARTIANREAKQAAARVASLAEVEPCEPVVMAELLGEIRAARDHNTMVDREQQRRDEQERSITQMFDRAGALQREAERLQAEATLLLAHAEQADVAFAALPPLAARIDVDALEARIAEAEAVNAQHRAYQERAAAVDAAEKLQADADAFTARLKAREEERASVIRSAAFPVPDLGLTDEGVTYRGLPLEQASGAEQLRVSVAIAMAMSPTLRVLRIQDGSLLDDRSLALLEAMAREHDFQVWIEQVDTSGTVGIVMEDGTARVASTEVTPKRRRMAVGA